ncbi:acid protease [Suillus decipiens]|nr:acid protease [Suillus decipiens]
MFSVVFSLVLLAFSVTGSPVEVRNPPITLPMTGRLAFSNVTALLRPDSEARLAAFGEYSTHGRSDAYIRRPRIPLSQADLGGGFFGYTVKVNIGNPPTTYNLIVDSASAITWVGSGVPYLSRSGVDTGEPVAVDYRYGSFRGTIFVDQLSFEGVANFIVSGMPIGVVFNAQDIAINVDGVLGIGPTSLSLGALPNSLRQMIPDIADFLQSRYYIGRAVVGMFFRPTSANPHDNGELLIGGTDPGMYDFIIYADVTAVAPSSQYWGIDQRITYAGEDILVQTAGVVDSGCTFLYLASDAYERYRAATGGILNPANGLLQISLQQYDQLHDLQFHMRGRIYKLVPNAQIWPRSLNYNINGGLNDIFLIVKALETPTGAGKDFVLGYVFLQRFFTVFDSDKRRVGFAKTAYTDIVVN